ncbi:hypothetical protein [Micromonospora rubida]
MTAQWWSWALTAIGLTGWWLTGRRMWQGWAVAIAVQILWLAYALATAQYGFIVASVAYGALAAHNLRRWLLTEATAPAEHLHYRHQVGACPTQGECPGHRAPAGALALLDDLRTAGRLSYVGPAAPSAWLTRLTRR